MRVEPRARAGGLMSSALGVQEPGLDGMRGLAVLAVLVYHAQVSWAQGGFLAISAFFTLSGFLITGVLLRNHLHPGGSLRSFWVRRARRLMPAAFIALTGIVVFGATVATRQQVETLPGDVLAAATWTANWRFVLTGRSYVDLFAAPSPVQHFWSLAIEEQFYILLPIGLLLLLRRTRSPRVIAAVLGGGALLSSAWMFALYEHGASLDRLYYGTDTRMAELLAGAALGAVIWRTGYAFSERTRWLLAGVGLVGFVATLWCWANVALGDAWLWRGGFLALSLASCTVILAVLAGRGPVALVLSRGPLPAIGRLTYGLYVYHFPIYLWLTEQRTGLSLWPLLALRLVLTFSVAIVSYRYVEQPILRGASFGIRRREVRYALIPIIAVAVVAAAFVTVNRSATDPLATLRASDAMPIAGGTGVFKLLVIPATANDPVVARLEQQSSSDPALSVTTAPPFECTGGLVATKAGRTCANWAKSWPALVARVDPDAVLLYVDDWAGDSIGKLSGRPKRKQADAAARILNPALDLLTARGAPVVWAYSGSYVDALRQYNGAFNQAMLRLEAQRRDLYSVIGLPDAATISRDRFVSSSVSILLADAALYKRTTDTGLPRVMIVGDSQALSLGYGLDQWATQTKRAVVWNHGIEGCGVAVDGEVRGFGGSVSGQEQCREAAAAWPTQVKAFRPDVVIVLSSLSDIQDRRLPGASKSSSIGQPAFDAFLLKEYEHVVDALSKTGAQVVWMTAPCTAIKAGSIGQPSPYNTSHIDHLDTKILPDLARARPGHVVMFDLAAVICPGGKPLVSVAGVKDLRPDGVHFSVDGSLWFARNYGAQVLKRGGL